MVSKTFTFTASTSGYTEQLLEVTITKPFPKSKDNDYIKMQPGSVQIRNGNSPVLIECITSEEETTDWQQGGFYMSPSEVTTLDFNLGCWKIKAKAVTGSSDIRINALFYLRTSAFEQH